MADPHYNSKDQSIFSEPAIQANPQLSQLQAKGDLACPQCGYNRREIPIGSPCPECGHQVYDRPDTAPRADMTAMPEPVRLAARSQEPTAPVLSESQQEELARHSVFNEPGVFSPQQQTALAPGQVSYASWLREKIAGTTWAKSWGVVLLIMLIGGPWAVLAAMFNNSTFAANIALLVVLVAPIIEEVMKVALASWLVEKRPYLFKSAMQVRIACVASGFMFGILENVYYVTLVLPAVNAPPEVYTFRWIVCTALHTVTTTISSFGLVRVWRGSIEPLREPDFDRALPFLIAAMIVHGVYNGSALIFELVRQAS